ncbi:MAG: WbuC family cupin fold metalloprotein [Magnetospirillum sp.]
MKSISAENLHDLAAQARAVPRLRKNLNLHDQLEDPIQRLLNALQPGTYIRPHRHPPGVWETFILLQGRCAILLFDDAGCISERLELSADGTLIAEIPTDTWHSVVALSPATLVLEIKPGPYVPGVFTDWSPEETSPQAQDCLRWLEQAQPGQSYVHD